MDQLLHISELMISRIIKPSGMHMNRVTCLLKCLQHQTPHLCCTCAYGRGHTKYTCLCHVLRWLGATSLISYTAFGKSCSPPHPRSEVSLYANKWIPEHGFLQHFHCLNAPKILLSSCLEALGVACPVKQDVIFLNYHCFSSANFFTVMISPLRHLSNLDNFHAHKNKLIK